MKKAIIWIIIIIIIIGGGVYLATRHGGSVTSQNNGGQTGSTTTGTGTSATSTQTGTSTGMETGTLPASGTPVSIGTSANGNPIYAYHYGSGAKEIMFVGGIHGGYEWNTVTVADDLMNYLKANPSAVPSNETITVIPVLNPDGLKTTVGTTSPAFSPSSVPTAAGATVSGRFNGNNVDLNRNFDCDWTAHATWQSTPVSGGTAAFSEPEAKAMQSYVQAHNPTAVIVYYSAAGGVYSSNCHNGVLPETQTLTQLYANASGYPAHETWSYYATTGDMTNWLAKIGVPAISVLLTNHTSAEWSKNEAGAKAVIAHYAQ